MKKSNSKTYFLPPSLPPYLRGGLDVDLLQGEVDIRVLAASIAVVRDQVLGVVVLAWGEGREGGREGREGGREGREGGGA